MKMARTSAVLLLILLIIIMLPVSVIAKAEGVPLTYSYDLLDDGTIRITKCLLQKDYAGEDIIIPTTIDGYTVSVIGSECFNGYGLGKNEWNPNISVGIIVIPDTVTRIEAFAFHDMSVNHISLPSSITEIAEGAFAVQYTTIMCDSDCENYTVVSNSLYEKSSKKLIAGGFTILDGIKTIGDYACYGREFTSEDGYTIPDSVTEIHSNAFNSAKIRCNGDTFTIPAEVIEYAAFKDCVFQFYGLENMPDAQCVFIFNQNLTAIPDDCFSGASATRNSHYSHRWSKNLLKYVSGNEMVKQTVSMVLPDGTTNIGNNAFYDTTAIRLDGGFPDALQSIGKYAFYSTDVEIDAKNVFGNCQALEFIGAYAFCDARIATLLDVDDVFVIDIPATVTSIGESAFQYDKVAFQTLKLDPSAIMFVEKMSAHEIYIHSAVLQIGDDAFVKSKVTLNVESGSYAEQWAKDNIYRYTIIGAETDNLDWLND